MSVFAILNDYIYFSDVCGKRDNQGMRQAPNGDMCMVWTDGRNGEDHDIYFVRQGLIRLPIWAWITIGGGIVFITGITTILIIHRRKRV